MIKKIYLNDPLSKERVPALSIGNEHGLELITIPDRALDIYRLRYRGTDISHTNYEAGISPKNFTENGTEGFGRNFFVGFLTTCGLCNAGRPCEDGGRSYGLHGCISNTPCQNPDITEENGVIKVRGTADEIHEDGVHMRLTREINLDTEKDRLTVHDTTANLSELPQPYMMMYHINFGAPFLSENLCVDADFSYIENRDTGAAEPKEQVLSMGAAGSASQETVYYTQADLKRGVTLYNPDLAVKALLCAEGDGLEWMGIWKNFVSSPYALGIEPCICPGLGRAGARKRGLLAVMQPGEVRKNTITFTIQI